MYVVLETERMILRRLTGADVDNLVELDSDPEVMRYLTGGRATPRDVVADELLPRLLDEYDRTPGYGRWAAIDRDTGAFLGWFGLRQGAVDEAVDEATSEAASASGGDAGPELGYRLRKPAWGNGFGTEGSRGVIRLAFTELAVPRVWAQTMAINRASRRVMEKAGMRFVRTFHLTWDDPIDGAEHGEVEYELRRPDWHAG